MNQTELFDPEDFRDDFPELTEDEINRRTLAIIDRWTPSQRVIRGWNPNGSTPVFTEEDLLQDT